MVKNDKIDRITICGGALCIDFINTVKDRVSNPMMDYLSDFADLLYWAKRLEIIDVRSYKELLQHATRHPNQASAFFKETIAFRELLYQVLHTTVKTGKATPALLDGYNRVLADYFSCKKIEQLNSELVSGWHFGKGSFKHILAGIVDDSYELLLSADLLEKVKECPKCHWLFLDTTKNGKRRWCTMKTCGASVKALEWYHRHKS